jgi:hypothetical protein
VFFRRNPPDAPAPARQIIPAPPAHPHADELRHTLRLVLLDSLASETMGTLTSGVFLAGLAVALDASNLMIGVLAAIPFLVQFLQVPAVLLVERLRQHRCFPTAARSSRSRCWSRSIKASARLPDAPGTRGCAT